MCDTVTQSSISQDVHICAKYGHSVIRYIPGSTAKAGARLFCTLGKANYLHPLQNTTNLYKTVTLKGQYCAPLRSTP